MKKPFLLPEVNMRKHFLTPLDVVAPNMRKQSIMCLAELDFGRVDADAGYAGTRFRLD
ncbi:MAG: hypothetical protein H6Q99_1669 [Proteobacteria bacterium]|nr:hypothetical protein [Pseudomonadota bacterium]